MILVKCLVLSYIYCIANSIKYNNEYFVITIRCELLSYGLFLNPDTRDLYMLKMSHLGFVRSLT